jgi:hypothetical protein
MKSNSAITKAGDLNCNEACSWVENLVTLAHHYVSLYTVLTYIIKVTFHRPLLLFPNGIQDTQVCHCTLPFLVVTVKLKEGTVFTSERVCVYPGILILQLALAR